MKESQVIKALASLANEARLRIIRQLIVAGDSGLSAGAIGEAINAAPSKVSFHVAALERAGLATSERVSRQIIYRANFAELGGVLNFLIADCCGNNAQIRELCQCDKSTACC